MQFVYMGCLFPSLSLRLKSVLGVRVLAVVDVADVNVFVVVVAAVVVIVF